ncbi:RING finger protein nhl-1-like [Trichoplusia ni]|uniref:RING finger protein nhl-1-like n=1 Tax=Trichoplusia ni TaxID=7111 RepID=A0A7E5WPF8_TRINI|nr:RING finger protein nhl-1-like [Trichoplusia ni]
MMSEKIKKKPPLFTLKRWQSQKESSVKLSPKSSHAPTQDSHVMFRSQTPPVVSRASITEPKPRKLSAGGIKELVQCALCLEVLHNPKMLPCQHTFCMACLSVYIADLAVFDCPICRTRIQVIGDSYIENLPSNLYIDSLLQLVGIQNNGETGKATPPPTPSAPVTPSKNSSPNVEFFPTGVRCVHCKSVCDNTDITSCDHCKLKFCRICWLQHLDDMRIQLKSILKQLDTAASHLEHKIEHYKDRCDRIVEQINIAADEKISAVVEARDKMIADAANMQKSADFSALALQSSLVEARAVANRATDSANTTNDNERVATFINLHQNVIQLLSDVSKWDTERFVFDKENFRIEIDSSTPLDAESDDPVIDSPKQNNPLENEESLALYYRSRNFVPHYVLRKSYRPCGVGVSPWTNHLYVCGMDSQSVLVMERAQAKTVTRLSCDEMMCPVQIAFMKSLGEIYVTDKWKHCIHVFSKDGEYLRSIGQKGSRAGMLRSPEGIATDNTTQLIYVVDTGNDRVQVFQPDGKVVDQIGVGTKHQASVAASIWETKEVLCTELNAPTSVAVTNDRVIVLDSGNRRVKVYNKHDKSKIIEFGSTGQRKGQFRQPEVLAVDPLGYILVGDSGNCRIQVFKPSGQLVRVFGGLGTQPGKFGWISGIHVTKQLDIIISDTKNHNVNFF